MSTCKPYDVDMVNIKQLKMWTASPALTVVTILMAVAFVASAAGIFLDHRLITGVPAWLKPTKFAISSAIFSGAMGWLFAYLTVWPRLVKAAGWTIAAVLVIEVAIIDVQAARGTTSHFNAATTLDAVLFGIMGFCIALLWLASVVILVALFRQRFDNPAWGWWLRMGMLVTVIGAGAGGLMVRPTPSQAAALRTGQQVQAVGAHTVGAPDGGPGLTGVGWSTQHGDLRVPHFFGLHAVQILPFLGWFLLRRQGGRGRRGTATAIAVGSSYALLVTILGWQALRGQPFIQPDAMTLLVGSVWFFTSAAGLWLIYRFVPCEDSGIPSNVSSVVTPAGRDAGFSARGSITAAGWTGRA